MNKYFNMNFDKLTKIILKEAHGIPSVYDVKKRREDIEKKYEYLRQDEDFIDYVTDIVAANAEDLEYERREDSGLFDQNGEVDMTLARDVAKDRMTEPLELEELADEYFEYNPDKKLKLYVSQDPMNEFGDFMKEL